VGENREYQSIEPSTLKRQTRNIPICNKDLQVCIILWKKHLQFNILQLLAQWEHTWYSSYEEAKGPSKQEKKKEWRPSTTEDATFHIYIGAFCLLSIQDRSLYILGLFSRSYESSLTVQKNEITISRYPQRLPMSPATFWATTFLASSETGESPIYMSKKASVHQTGNSY
jgi:hypothetical protein